MSVTYNTDEMEEIVTYDPDSSIFQGSSKFQDYIVYTNRSIPSLLPWETAGRRERERETQRENKKREKTMAAEMEASTGGSIQQEPSSDGMEAAVASKAPHKLERKWTFWFDNQSKPKQGAAWGSSLRNVYTFDTVEEFWR